jgi:hypothetical protein
MLAQGRRCGLSPQSIGQVVIWPNRKDGLPQDRSEPGDNVLHAGPEANEHKNRVPEQGAIYERE